MTPPILRFLDERRIRVYPRLVVAVYLLGALGLVLASHGGVDPLRKPLGYDFTAFYAGGRLALLGQAAAAYDLAAIHVMSTSLFPGMGPIVFGWYYPPTYFLIQAPLAALPYGLAWALWITGTGALLAFAVRPALRDPSVPWLLLAAPAAMLNLFHGQNGFLTAALFILGLRLLDERPMLSGLCWGLLTMKPHLGLLVPLVLLVGGYGRVIASAAATTIILVLASVLCFGLEPWRAFLTHTPELVSLLLERGILPWAKMLSLFTALRRLGVPSDVAWGIHLAWAVAVALAVAWLWWRRADLELRASALMLGALMVSPHGFDYDLVLSLGPIWLMARRARRLGWLPFEAEALLLLYLAPFLAGMLAHLPVLPVMPLALILAFLAVIRRWSVESRLATGSSEPMAMPLRGAALGPRG